MGWFDVGVKMNAEGKIAGVREYQDDTHYVDYTIDEWNKMLTREPPPE